MLFIIGIKLMFNLKIIILLFGFHLFWNAEEFYESWME